MQIVVGDPPGANARAACRARDDARRILGETAARDLPAPGRRRRAHATRAGRARPRRGPRHGTGDEALMAEHAASRALARAAARRAVAAGRRLGYASRRIDLLPDAKGPWTAPAPRRDPRRAPEPLPRQGDAQHAPLAGRPPVARPPERPVPPRRRRAAAHARPRGGHGHQPGQRDGHRRPHGAARPRRAPSATRTTGGSSASQLTDEGRSLIAGMVATSGATTRPAPRRAHRRGARRASSSARAPCAALATRLHDELEADGPPATPTDTPTQPEADTLEASR